MGPGFSARLATALSVHLPDLDRIVRGLLYVYIFSLPFSRLLFVERIGFVILIVLLVLWCVVNREHFFLKTPVDLPLVAFLGWVAFTIPFATDPGYSLGEYKKLLQQALVFYAVVYFFRQAEDKIHLVWMLMGSLIVISAYGIAQFETGPWYGKDMPGSRTYYLIESFTPGEVWLTTYLVMLIPLALTSASFASSTWLRWAAGAGALLGFICEALTFSRAGLLALMVEVGVFLAVGRWRKAMIVTLCGVLLVLALSAAFFIAFWDDPKAVDFIPGQSKLTTYNLDARFNVWVLALDILAESPIVGIGFGKDNFQRVTEQRGWKPGDEGELVMPGGTHNTFIDIAVGTGLPGGLIFLWLLTIMAKAAYDSFRQPSEPLAPWLPSALILILAGMVVRNSFDHMWVGTLAVQFWVLAGLCQPLAQQTRKAALPWKADPNCA